MIRILVVYKYALWNTLYLQQTKLTSDTLEIVITFSNMATIVIYVICLLSTSCIGIYSSTLLNTLHM